MQAYHKCVREVRFYGPTNFAPIVQAAARKASTYRNGNKYQVSREIESLTISSFQILLIVTDGAICDMIPTTKAIVEASGLPMSIIIVGVGNADFDKMDELDGDNVRLSYNGRYAERDIVQFVPINDFTERNIVIPENIMAALAKEVLAEVSYICLRLCLCVKINPFQLPLQLTTYMRSRNIAPLPPSYQEPTSLNPILENCHLASAPPIGFNDISFNMGAV